MKNQTVHTAIAVFLSEADADKHGIETSQSVMREFAHTLQLSVAGFLAIAPEEIETGLDSALQLCASHNCSVLLLQSPELFFVAQKKLLQLFTTIESQKLSIACADDGIVIEHTVLKLWLSILVASDRAESSARSRMIKQSLHKKRRLGKELGGRQFGVHKSEKQVVQQILTLHNDGASLQKICTMLREHNIKTVHNKSWHPTTVKRIIDRAKQRRRER